MDASAGTMSPERPGVAVDEMQIPEADNDARVIVDRFAAAITPRTRVVAFAHLLGSTGLRMPVAELSALGMWISWWRH